MFGSAKIKVAAEQGLVFISGDSSLDAAHVCPFRCIRKSVDEVRSDLRNQLNWEEGQQCFDRVFELKPDIELLTILDNRWDLYCGGMVQHISTLPGSISLVNHAPDNGFCFADCTNRRFSYREQPGDEGGQRTTRAVRFFLRDPWEGEMMERFPIIQDIGDHIPLQMTTLD